MTFCETTVKVHGHTLMDTSVKSDAEKMDAVIDRSSPIGMEGASRTNGKKKCLNRFLSVSGTDKTHPPTNT